jgi:hypothetical protein
MLKVNVKNLNCFSGFFWRMNSSTSPDQNRPLVLFLHGGPHASIQNEYTILRELLLKSGREGLN